MAGLTRLLSTSTIRPATVDRPSDVNRRIELTPCDVQYIDFGYSHRGFVFEKPEKNPVEHLKASLSLALDRLYPLAGRLVATEHDGDTKTVSYHIDCSDAGATFFHAEAVERVTVADVLDPPVVPRETIASFFSMFDRAAGPDPPLLVVQVTELADGIFIGVGISHAIADGTTFYDFISVWAELARGDSDAISRRGGFVFNRHEEFPVGVPLRQSEAPVGAVAAPPPPPVEQRVFRFSRDKIAELKAKANTGTEKREISSLQALLAHLWVCITRSRELSTDTEVFISVPVGMRSLLDPPLPRSYFGNAYALTGVKCTAGELLGGGTVWAARRINGAIAAHAGMEEREFFSGCPNKPLMSDYLKLYPNWLAMGGSQRFDMYGNDFGWGRPLGHLSFVPNNGHGLLLVAPGIVEGSIDIEAVLFAETFNALAGDPEFAHYSS